VSAMFLLKPKLMIIRKWHWMSSAICFFCMLLFAITGITLNHASVIEGEAHVQQELGQLPDAVLKILQEKLVRLDQGNSMPLPKTVRQWFTNNLSIGDKPLRFNADWDSDEVYVAMPRPGGDAWLSIDLHSGEFEYEASDRGWLAYANDLHKGRNTGSAWIWFMDIFALACVIFSVTGLLLLQRYADTRAATWPLVGAGLLIPLGVIAFFSHV
jgi:uncharacterized protein